ncbi:MAG: hypothetical protein ABSE73_19890 [Planctomycetota bacterium]
MIEINLLPEELRRTEGTPPGRLAVILGGVLLACGIGILIAKIQINDIPTMKDNIKVCELAIKKDTEKKQEIEANRVKINEFEEKNKVLNNLMQSRIRYARLLYTLAKTVPEGAWFKSFNVSADSGVTPPDVLPGAKRFMIALTGFTTSPQRGNPAQARRDEQESLVALMNNLESAFCTVDKNTKVNTFLGARFRPPKVPQRQVAALPPPPTADPGLKAAELPKEGLDFSLTMSFELPQQALGQ